MRIRKLKRWEKSLGILFIGVWPVSDRPTAADAKKLLLLISVEMRYFFSFTIFFTYICLTARRVVGKVTLTFRLIFLRLHLVSSLNFFFLFFFFCSLLLLLAAPFLLLLFFFLFNIKQKHTN